MIWTGEQSLGGGDGSWAFVSFHPFTSMVFHMRPASCTHLNWALLSMLGSSRQLGDAFKNKAVWKIPFRCAVAQSPILS